MKKGAGKEQRGRQGLDILGLESVKRKMGLARVVDLSAHAFILSGSGEAEGTLFPLDNERLFFSWMQSNAAS